MRITRQVTLADQTADRYLRIPFEVPEGAPSLEVRLTVEGAGAVVDLGCEGPNGWRGWSGGARRDLVITADRADPGYLPGPLEGGTWHVILGLHLLPAGHAQVTVEADVPATRPPETPPHVQPRLGVSRGSARGLPAPPGMRWIAGDFHAHTRHSDGGLWTAELARLAVDSGLDFLAVTDHNTVSHHAELPQISQEQGILLIPGQEVTTHRGHANAFGDIGWIDFRAPGDRWVGEVARRGGLLSINHPISGDCSWLWDLPTPPHAVEIVHADWFRALNSTAPLAYLRRLGAGASLIGGSDFHSLDSPVRPGLPTTWVCVEEVSVGGVLDAVRSGRTAVTLGGRLVDGVGQPELVHTPALVRVGGDVVASDAVGTVLVDGMGWRTVVSEAHLQVAAPREAGPYRLEAPDRSILALSS